MVWVLKAEQGREGRKSTVGGKTWGETVNSDAQRRGRMGENTENCSVAVFLGRKVGEKAAKGGILSPAHTETRSAESLLGARLGSRIRRTWGKMSLG